MTSDIKRKRCPKCRCNLHLREEYAGSLKFVKWCMECGWISKAMKTSELRQEIPEDKE